MVLLKRRVGVSLGFAGARALQSAQHQAWVDSLVMKQAHPPHVQHEGAISMAIASCCLLLMHETTTAPSVEACGQHTATAVANMSSVRHRYLLFLKQPHHNGPVMVLAQSNAIATAESIS